MLPTTASPPKPKSPLNADNSTPELKLRKACDACSLAHSSCSGDQPKCVRCQTKNVKCIYSPVNSPYIATTGQTVSLKKSRKNSVSRAKREAASPISRTESSGSSSISSPATLTRDATWMPQELVQMISPSLTTPINPQNFESPGPVRTPPRKPKGKPEKLDMNNWNPNPLQSGLATPNHGLLLHSPTTVPTPGLSTPGLSTAFNNLFVDPLQAILVQNNRTSPVLSLPLIPTSYNPLVEQEYKLHTELLELQQKQHNLEVMRRNVEAALVQVQEQRQDLLSPSYANYRDKTVTPQTLSSGSLTNTPNSQYSPAKNTSPNSLSSPQPPQPDPYLTQAIQGDFEYLDPTSLVNPPTLVNSTILNPLIAPFFVRHSSDSSLDRYNP